MPPDDRAVAAHTPLHVSVVSHGHGALVRDLLRDLAEAATPGLQVTVTLNVPEPLAFDPGGSPFPLSVVENRAPRGFGGNHNAAFRRGPAEGWFCVANPDVRVGADVLARLAATLAAHPSAAVAAPRVRDQAGRLQNSARRLPTPARIARRALPLRPGLDYPAGSGRRQVDWVAGMLMLFPARVFAELRGFDERFFLYYEDVDLCCRARLAGYEVLLDETTSVTHDGLWDSHRNPRYLAWHLASMARFLGSRVYRDARRAERADREGWPARPLAAPPEHERP
jgi:GT2 family glycosyltransferase